MKKTPETYQELSALLKECNEEVALFSGKTRDLSGEEQVFYDKVVEAMQRKRDEVQKLLEGLQQ